MPSKSACSREKLKLMLTLSIKLNITLSMTNIDEFNNACMYRSNQDCKNSVKIVLWRGHNA